MAVEQPGTFGSYVPNDILDQIELRQKIHARKLPDGTADAERLYQTEYHNAPWVCLRSSVDVPTEEYKPGTKPPTDGGALAKQFVLCGGTMQLVDGKLTFVGDSNLGAAGYGLDSTYGYRPRPGITKVQVKTKDTFGCIMEATVNFTVYSLDDLEAVDQLYFKPGMSALLEWGHSEYVCNDSKLYKATKARLFDLEGFFTSQDSYEEINEKLQTWRASSQFDGNYEAMFGLITNFSWSFNNDGSYSCTIKMLSQGTILAGLQIPAKIGLITGTANEGIIDLRLRELRARKTEVDREVERWRGTGDPRFQEAGNEQSALGRQIRSLENMKASGSVDSTEDQQYALKSAFHWVGTRILDDIETHVLNYPVNYSGDPYTAELAAAEVLSQPSGSVESSRDWRTGTYQDSIFGPYKWVGRMIQVSDGDKPEKPVAYLPINELLKIFNTVFEIQADKLKIGFTRFETRGDQNYVEQAFATFSEHFSLNPNEVLLPFSPSSPKEGSTFFMIRDGAEEKSMTVNEILERLVVIQPSTLATGLNRIGDILIEVGFILKCLDDVLDSEKGTYNVQEFLNNLLSGIQTALGNVNEFGIHINHTTETASIVDRRCISHNNYGSSEDRKIIVSGPWTTLTGLQINSEVSPEIASEMSIAATAPADGKKIDRSNPNQVFWNEGCIDRHRTGKSVKSKSAERAAAARPKVTGSFLVNYPTGSRTTTSSEGYYDDEGNFISKEDGTILETPEDSAGIFSDAGDFFSRALGLYGIFNGKGGETEGVDWNYIQQDGQVLFNSCLVRDLVTQGALDKTTESYLQSGIIPIKVGFTMKGIGRFVVGTTFKISEGLVPKKYRTWRNLITGVEHSIDKSGWKTTVTALYYPVIGKVGNIRPGSGTFNWDTEAANYRQANNISGGAVYDISSWEIVGKTVNPEDINPTDAGTRKNKITEIIIHCSANQVSAKLDAESIDKMHRGSNGWQGIGYNYVILQDGTIQAGRPLNLIGGHATGHNTKSIGICYIGGINSKGQATDTRTPAQIRALTSLIKQLLAKFPTIKKIDGHRNAAENGTFSKGAINKGCPSFSVSAFLRSIGLAQYIAVNEEA